MVVVECLASADRRSTLWMDPFVWLVEEGKLSCKANLGKVPGWQLLKEGKNVRSQA